MTRTLERARTVATHSLPFVAFQNGDRTAHLNMDHLRVVIGRLEEEPGGKPWPELPGCDSAAEPTGSGVNLVRNFIDVTEA